MPTPFPPFLAPVLRQPTGQRYHYLPLPDDLAAALQAQGVRRVVVQLNGQTYRRGVQTVSEGVRCLVTGLSILRAIGATLGDLVEVVLTPDPDPKAIDLGEAFTAALAQDTEAAARFYSFTPGRQRSLAYYVTSAKRPATQAKRALELAHKIRTYTLYGDTPPDPA